MDAIIRHAMLHDARDQSSRTYLALALIQHLNYTTPEMYVSQLQIRSSSVYDVAILSFNDTLSERLKRHRLLKQTYQSS